MHGKVDAESYAASFQTVIPLSAGCFGFHFAYLYSQRNDMQSYLVKRQSSSVVPLFQDKSNLLLDRVQQSPPATGTESVG